MFENVVAQSVYIYIPKNICVHFQWNPKLNHATQL